MREKATEAGRRSRSDGSPVDSRAARSAGREAGAERPPERTVAHAAESNSLLKALSAAEYALLLPQLSPVRLRAGEWLVREQEPLSHVFFVREGLVSLLATDRADSRVEVGTIGCEGLIGLHVLFAVDAIPFGVQTRIEGTAWRMPVQAFAEVLATRPAVHHLCLRYAQYFIEQLAQAAACNQLHPLDQRLARWLLTSHDSVRGDEFELTHEALALMLGVRRAGVSEAMGSLQEAGIVRSARGRITILDRRRLQLASCVCHGIVDEAKQRLIA